MFLVKQYTFLIKKDVFLVKLTTILVKLMHIRNNNVFKMNKSKGKLPDIRFEV